MFGILILIVANLAIGYGLAVYQLRPERFALAWRFLPTALPPVPTNVAVSKDVPTSKPTPVALAETAVIEPQPAESPPIAAAEESAATETADADQLVSMIQAELNRYCSGLSELDQQVQKHTDDKSMSGVKLCVESFDRLSDGYLEQQEINLKSLLSNANEDPQAWVAPCKAAVEQQTAAIHTARDNLALAAALAEPAAACRAFLQATQTLAEANQTAQQELARNLEGAAAKSGASEADQRAAMERAVAEFIRIQVNFGEKFSVALVEVDQLNIINTRHSQIVGNRIFEAIKSTFVALTPRSTLSTDEEHQRILYFQGDASSRETTSGVEQVRQRIDAATFQYGSVPLHVTLTSGVAEALCSEEPAKIVSRLQDILREARRYGENRTFFQEGKHSSPAIPPSVAVEKRIIEV